MEGGKGKKLEMENVCEKKHNPRGYPLRIIMKKFANFTLNVTFFDEFFEKF